MRYRRLYIVVLVIAVVLGVEWLWLRSGAIDPSPPLLPRMVADGATVPDGDFSLVSHDGRRVTRDSFKDSFLLLSFGYTACPDICPLTLATVAQVLERLGPLSSQLQALFVTLDPERDSAAVLADYVSHFDPRIVGLTGTLAEVQDVARKYRVRFAKTGRGPDYSLDHGAALYLVAPDGRVLRYFRHDVAQADLERMVAAALGDPSLALTFANDKVDARALQFAGELPTEERKTHEHAGHE